MIKATVRCFLFLAALACVYGCSDRSDSKRQPASSPASSNAAATAPAGVPTVADIRAMILKAIAMKEDPEEARALMARASDLASKLPPGSDLSALVIEFTPDKGQLDHLMKPTETRAREATTQLSATISMRERFRSETLSFTGMADNGKGFIFPRPMTGEARTEQTVLQGERTIFSVVARPHRETRWKTYYVSPDEKRIVLQDWLHAKPTQVLSVEKGDSVTVESIEIEGHYNVYPFDFLRWEKDSASFLVEVKGSYVKGPGQFLAYRELWQVQADTGKVTRIKRQEQPWEKTLTWDD